MKKVLTLLKSIFIFIVGLLLLCCDNTKDLNEPELPDVPELPEVDLYTLNELPCGCPDEWTLEEIDYKRELPWNYPIKPGTDEWVELQFGELGGLETALKIPDSILGSLSTEDLVAIIILHPLLPSVINSDFFEIGLDNGFSSLNGIGELFQREDGLEELLKHYKYMTQNWSSLYGVVLYPYLTVLTLELILSRYQSPDASNKDNYTKIVKYLLCGLEKQILYEQTNNNEVILFNYKSNFYSRAIILMKIDEQNLEKIPDGINNRLFLKEHWLYEPALQAIGELTCKYIYNNQ